LSRDKSGPTALAGPLNWLVKSLKHSQNWPWLICAISRQGGRDGLVLSSREAKVGDPTKQMTTSWIYLWSWRNMSTFVIYGVVVNFVRWQ